MKKETTGKKEFYFEDLPEHEQEVVIELLADIVRIMKTNAKEKAPKKKAKQGKKPISIRLRQE